MVSSIIALIRNVEKWPTQLKCMEGCLFHFALGDKISSFILNLALNVMA